MKTVQWITTLRCSDVRALSLSDLFGTEKCLSPASVPFHPVIESVFFIGYEVEINIKYMNSSVIFLRKGALNSNRALRS